MIFNTFFIAVNIFDRAIYYVGDKIFNDVCEPGSPPPFIAS